MSISCTTESIVGLCATLGIPTGETATIQALLPEVIVNSWRSIWSPLPAWTTAICL